MGLRYELLKVESTLSMVIAQKFVLEYEPVKTTTRVCRWRPGRPRPYKAVHG